MSDHDQWVIHDLIMKANDLEHRIIRLERDLEIERKERNQLEAWVGDLQQAIAKTHAMP